ncbi:MAG: hypothetical protein AAGI25_13640 [Bacteroidota bacterium]
MQPYKKINLTIYLLCLMFFFSCQSDDVQVTDDLSALGLIDESAAGDLKLFDKVIYNNIEYKMLDILTDESLYASYVNAAGYHAKNRVLTIYEGDQADNARMDLITKNDNARSAESDDDSDPETVTACLLVFFEDVDYGGAFYSEDILWTNVEIGDSDNYINNQLPSVMNNVASSVVMSAQTAGGITGVDKIFAKVIVKLYNHHNLGDKVFDRTLTYSQPSYSLADLGGANDKVSSYKIEFFNYGGDTIFID